MTYFWILYSLAGLAFVIAYLDYFLPWALKHIESSADKMQIEIVLNTPVVKATAGVIVFLIWPLLFILFVGYLLLGIGIFLIEEAAYWTRRAYWQLKWECIKFIYRRKRMAELRKIIRHARASYKIGVENDIKEILQQARDARKTNAEVVRDNA